MQKTSLLLSVILASFLALGACDPSAQLTLPQGTFLREDNPKIQTLFNEMPNASFSTIVPWRGDRGAGPVNPSALNDIFEEAYLEIIDEFNGARPYGVGGGRHCKAYRLTFQTGAKEVGVLCRNGALIHNPQWEHRPWRDYFHRLR